MKDNQEARKVLKPNRIALRPSWIKESLDQNRMVIVEYLPDGTVKLIPAKVMKK